MTTPMWESGDPGTAPASQSPWDTVVLGGNALPGRADVKVKRERQTDTKKAPGEEGAGQTDHGYKPADVDITLTLWTADQLKAMDKVRLQLEPRPARKPITGTYEDFGLTAADQGNGNGIGGLDIRGPRPFGPSQIKQPVLRPLSIRHPACAMRSVRSVYVLSVEGPHPGKERGTMEWQLKCREFTKASKVNVTSTAKASTDITKLDQAITTDSPAPPDKTDAHP